MTLHLATGDRTRAATGAAPARSPSSGRTYRVRHRSRWRTVVEVEDQQLAVLTRRVLSKRNVPLERTELPSVRTTAMIEPDQLAVVLAASVMGPPGRTGFWGEVGGELVPW